MICRFSFGYNTLKNLTPETYTKLRAHLMELPEDQTKAESFGSFEADIRPILALKVGIEITERAAGSTLVAVFDRLDQIEEIVKRPREITAEQNFNARVNVHVPGLGLMLINEVELLQDGCTDALNKKLSPDEGWRILAICPQPDQRRPDYILGRSKTENQW